jgi:hypothetical protein
MSSGKNLKKDLVRGLWVDLYNLDLFRGWLVHRKKNLCDFCDFRLTYCWDHGPRMLSLEMASSSPEKNKNRSFNSPC